jgi:hypothetical protein
LSRRRSQHALCLAQQEGVGILLRKVRGAKAQNRVPGSGQHSGQEEPPFINEYYACRKG